VSKELKDFVRPDKRSRRELQQAGADADRWVANAFTIGGALIGGLGGLLRATGRNQHDFVGMPLVITLLSALVGGWLGRRLAQARAK
jgi:hypothetical protein